MPPSPTAYSLVGQVNVASSLSHAILSEGVPRSCVATDVLGEMECEMLPHALSLLWAVPQSASSPTVNRSVGSRVVWRLLG